VKIEDFKLTQEEINLICKAKQVEEEEDIAEQFGNPCDCLGHLGVVDERLGRLWAWECPNHIVVTFDEGNCCCNVVYVKCK